MEKQNVNRTLSDAVDLLKMIEHLVEGFRASSPAEIPWAGMRLTLSQTRELVSSVIEAPPQTRQSSSARARSVEADPGIEEPARPSGRIRELPDESQYAGTFNRVQLTRDSSDLHNGT